MRTLLAAALLLALSLRTAAQGTSITYQGQLIENGRLANGTYDIQFSLWNDATGTNIVAGPLLVTNIVIAKGGFSVALDFGDVFQGQPLWLEIQVRTNGAAVFSEPPLAPRQLLSPAPTALYALRTAGLPGGTYTNALILTNAANRYYGSYVGDGAELSNLHGGQIQPGTVTGDALTDGAVTSQKLANGAVGPNHLQAGAVAGTAVSDGAITLQKLNTAGAAHGQYIQFDGSRGGAVWTNLLWQHLTGIPGDFDDGDDDTRYTAGAGLNLSGSEFTVVFAGTGIENTAARSDHTHDAAALSSGTLDDARLSPNIARLDADQIFSGANAFAGPTLVTNSANVFVGSFSGDGSGLINVPGGPPPPGSVGSAELAAGAVTATAVADGTLLPEDMNLDQFDSTFWRVGGNVLTDATTQFIGSLNNQPIEFHVNGRRALRLEAAGSSGVNVLGGNFNLIQSGTVGAVIAGGTGNTVDAADGYGTISGGANNLVSGYSSTIGGGHDNVISATGGSSTIGGGEYHRVDASYSTIAGGRTNRIEAPANFSSIGGGEFNLATSTAATIGGGSSNTNEASFGTIGGGNSNRIGADSYAATIGGGFANVIGSGAEGSVIPGGRTNVATAPYTFAAGFGAEAIHRGAFVWADDEGGGVRVAFPSTAANEFAVRANGGARFVSAAGSIEWPPGGGGFSMPSDRALKEDIRPVDPAEVLDKVSRLPISEWNYRGYPQRHVGPMAQDFHELFPLNERTTQLDPVDLHGVALAAIQGVNQKLQTELERKDKEIRELRAAVEELTRQIRELSR